MSTRKRPAPFDPSTPHDSPKRARASIEPQSQAQSHDSTNGHTRQRSRSPRASDGDRRTETRDRRSDGGRGADRREGRGGGGVAGRDERNGGRAGTNGTRRESPRRDRDRERSRSPRRAAGRGGGADAAGRGGRTGTSQRDRDDHRHGSAAPSGKPNGTTAPPTKGGKKANVKGEVVELDMDVDDDPDAALQRQMEKTMGFGKFKTTKNTKVPGNDKLYGVRKEKVMVARQYMNRVGGFNRPLSPSHE